MVESNGQPASGDSPPSPPTLQEMVGKCRKKTYLVEILVLDKAVRAPLSAISLESISHMASTFVAMNWPNVYGYNIFNETGTEILEMVNVVLFTNHFMKTIQQIAGAQVLKSAVPVIGSGEQGENLVKLMEEARKAGRLMPGTPAPAGPSSGGVTPPVGQKD